MRRQAYMLLPLLSVLVLSLLPVRSQSAGGSSGGSSGGVTPAMADSSGQSDDKTAAIIICTILGLCFCVWLIYRLLQKYASNILQALQAPSGQSAKAHDSEHWSGDTRERSRSATQARQPVIQQTAATSPKEEEVPKEAQDTPKDLELQSDPLSPHEQWTVTSDAHSIN